MSISKMFDLLRDRSIKIQAHSQSNKKEQTVVELNCYSLTAQLCTSQHQYGIDNVKSFAMHVIAYYFNFNTRMHGRAMR